nr:immunoglobulin heavy chain junction region [Mus musculus]MBK4187582.1 immunoglobulin heavy chain junction region [Mus musculus]MBK4187583.1 immunoglobulin heavy chain junction region [Mus musculus]MBK4187584.1 immunoglobulin heavy chain junction region [Mus musculus]MBK4187585.1 immunoglobulin heavy chain junction region [Mus musculus]
CARSEGYYEFDYW